MGSDRSKDGEKKKYNTQELLSLNMDRLKDYMKRMAKQASDQANPPVFEVPATRARGGTKIGKTPSACKLLALFENPHTFVQLVSENDSRPESRRYKLERACDCRDAIKRMTDVKYDLIMLSGFTVELEEVESQFSTPDMIIMLRGLQRTSDVYFLAKKRWFVMDLVDGETNSVKVDNFRKLREKYKDTPLIYLHDAGNEEEVKLIASVEKVRAVQFDPTDFGKLFFTLDELAFEA